MQSPFAAVAAIQGEHQPVQPHPVQLTQKNVVQKARITQAALSQMERTENQNKTATLKKLAAALNVSVEQLID